MVQLDIITFCECDGNIITIVRTSNMESTESVNVTEECVSDLTEENLLSGEWKELKLEKYDFFQRGTKLDRGHLHPLMQVRDEFRKAFLHSGYYEMDTTFFISGSLLNLLVTNKTLPTKPGKYFTIERVYCNHEEHFLEFYQVEAMVIDKVASLALLFACTEKYFKLFGFNDFRFKPAYNLYTEPGVEIYGYHYKLKKWIELAKGGIFRQRELQGHGVPEGLRAIAWWFSIDKQSIVNYNLTLLHNLLGKKVEFILTYDDKNSV